MSLRNAMGMTTQRDQEHDAGSEAESPRGRKEVWSGTTHSPITVYIAAEILPTYKRSAVAHLQCRQVTSATSAVVDRATLLALRYGSSRGWLGLGLGRRENGPGSQRESTPQTHLVTKVEEAHGETAEDDGKVEP